MVKSFSISAQAAAVWLHGRSSQSQPNRSSRVYDTALQLLQWSS